VEEAIKEKVLGNVSLREWGINKGKSERGFPVN